MKESDDMKPLPPPAPVPSPPGSAGPDPGSAPEHDLAEVVARKAARKERARAEGKRGLAHGLGMFGLVGWSVAVPTLLGIALGVWIDSRSGSRYSWALMLMIAGLIVGCLNAWYWVRRESENE